MSHWIEDIAPYIPLLVIGAAILLVNRGASKLHDWMKARGKPHVVPYVSGVVLSFVVFSGCALIFQMVTGPIGLHGYSYESGSFWIDNFIFIIGSSGALLAVHLIFLSRIASWKAVLPAAGATLLLGAIVVFRTDVLKDGPYLDFYRYLFVIVGLFLLLTGVAARAGKAED